MQYSVEGGTKKERQAVAEALWFAKDYLMPKVRKLAVDVIISKLDVDGDVLDGDEDLSLIHI